ncbi:MAG: YggS family pyridoxal phosphate-dependent enzyme, partial [Bacteroidota bacterium]
QLHNAGQKIFGENYVQELTVKQQELSKDIQWHFIGHLQSNKVKQIASAVNLIHSVDSLKLLKEINKCGEQSGIIINCLLQIYIAEEETKFGFDIKEANDVVQNTSSLKNINIKGLMGMATNTDNTSQIEKEFKQLYSLYTDLQKHFSLSILSMGMTADYKIALHCGSNMIRIGSALFGERG